MKFTGERYLPELTDFNISYEHWHRYLYANNFVKNKDVLDIACGDGYGSFYLSNEAKKVVGIDIDPEVIKSAQNFYKANNLTFIKGSASKIPINGNSLFDIIVSFETIEHISEKDQIKFLSEVKRLLKPEGIFIVSTPNKLLYSDIPKYHNKFHIKEFYRSEFEEFLNKSFKYTHILTQQILTASYMSDSFKEPNNILEFNLRLTEQGFAAIEEPNKDTYMIAVCSGKKIRRPQASITFDPSAEATKDDSLKQTLYFDIGNGLSEKDRMVKSFRISDNNNFTLDFDLSELNSVSALRLDPCDDFCTLKIRRSQLLLNDKTFEGLSFTTNASKTANGILTFETNDPQINFHAENFEQAANLLIEIEYVSIGKQNKLYSLQQRHLELEKLNYEIEKFKKEIKAQLQLVRQKELLINKHNKTILNEQALIQQLEISNNKKDDLIKQNNSIIKQNLRSAQNKQRIIQHYRKTISEKIRLLNKQYLSIDLLEKSLLIKESNIVSLDDQIREKDKIIRRKEKEIANNTDLIDQKNNLLLKTDQLLTEKNALISEQNNQISEKDKLLSETISLLHEKEDLSENQHREIKEKETEIVTKEMMNTRLKEALHSSEMLNDSLRNELNSNVIEIKNIRKSLSFSIGWFITAPARYVYNLFSHGASVKFRNMFLLKALIIAIKNPRQTIKNFNIRNIKTLIRALKQENKNTIINNFQKLIIKPENQENERAEIENTKIVSAQSHDSDPNLVHQIYLLNKSELFDEEYYLANNPNIETTGISAVEHYLLLGWKEGRNPCAKFNTKYYLSAHPDVADSLINPLIHYIEHGKAENRTISPDNFKTPEGEISKIEKHWNIGINPSTILFISHDARLAGAEILLLHLLKWLFEHTAIQLKIVCIEGGILLEKFQEFGPTLIWQDFIRDFPKKDERTDRLKQFCGRVGLIYGNTVISPSIYDEFGFLGADFITHVHELEKSIRQYVDLSTLKKMRRFSNYYIACSKPVALNLIQNHQVEPDQLTTIYAFIDRFNEDLTTISKPDIRKKLGLANDAFLVFGCGTIYWRKGVDHFIDTAIEVKKRGYSDFHFYWIGDQYWDSGHKSGEYPSWEELLQKISDEGIENNITFLGVKDNPREFFLAGDIFYLSAREDPFPLVCLEAAECQMPVICFDEAGGMPEFVEQDAGFIVPFENIEEAADKIIYASENKNILSELGKQARKKVLERHIVDIAAPQILEFCRQVAAIKPLVSVIIPNYNYEKYLKKRILSILDQTFKDFEIIILDDASTDGSLKIIEEFKHHPSIRIIKNQTNSGNPFLQWHKGFDEARGEIIWFAEADDFCESDFLQKLLPSFNNSEVALAYSDSNIIDGDDHITGDYQHYYEKLDPDHWKSSYQVTAVQEINFGLGIKNTIPNVSAVLFRKSFISEEIFNRTFQFKFSGDWFFYTQVIHGKKIAYCSEKLNYHRKTIQTITTKFNSGNLEVIIKEAEFIHKLIIEKYPLYADFLNKWEFYLTEQIHAFYPNTIKKDFNKYYPYLIFKKNIEKAIKQNRNNKRLIFITTNDGSPDGGSEKLWRHSAIECRNRGHEVMVVIKKWDPEPFFIKYFHQVGITVIYKEHNHFSQLLSFNPDLVVISIGDQDEGIDYYESCKINRLPYVIVNHLTKEPKYWPIRTDITERVKKGYLDAKIVLFTGRNNHEVMERRLDCKIKKAGIFYNPFDIDQNIEIPFPSMEQGLKIAIVGNLLRIHKGQHLAIELFNKEKWRNRSIHLNLYGRGNDEEILKKQVRDSKLINVTFHGHTNDILAVWKENHAIFLPSFMEGLPLVLVGAMICRRVPILTDIGAHREVVDDNINGFIAKEPTVEDLDEALERAYQNSVMWEEIGKKARKKILSIIPKDPIDDFISKIIPLTNKKQDYGLGCRLTVDEWAYVNKAAFDNHDLQKYVAPFPPIELMMNTTGLSKDSDFASHGADFWIALSKASPKPLHKFTSILDFGCGSGRLARMFKGYSGHLSGCDIDHRQVEWCSASLGYMEAKLSSVRPPIPFTDDEFEAVISISIFTHLNESSQDQFLQELRRVCKPDGVLFLTIHGRRALNRAIAEPSIKAMLSVDEDLFQAARKKIENGQYAFIIQQGHLTTIGQDGLRRDKVISDPFEYGITFIPEEYLRAHWTQWFDIVDYHVGAIHDFQDIVVLRPKK